MTDPSQRFRKPILIAVFVFSVGAVLYINMLARSMRGDYAQMQHLDQDVIHAPQHEPFNEKIETERAIIAAIRADDPQRLAAFFPQGVPKDAQVAKAPLVTRAVDLGAEKVLAYLVEQGADVNSRDAAGKTLLIEAARTAQPSFVKYLLLHGANVNSVDKDGKTALMNIGNVQTGQSSVSTRIFPTSHIANYSYAVPAQDEEETLRLLLEHGADVNSADKMGRTLLMWAVQEYPLAAVRLLIAQGANVKSTLSSGYSVLMYAIPREDPELLQLLLDTGADVNKPDTTIGTPLHYARSLNRKKIIPILLKAGARDEAH